MKHLKIMYSAGNVATAIIIVVVGLFLISIGGYFFYKTQYTSSGKTEVVAEFKEYRKIDKLFTAFEYTHVIDYRKGFLKREIYKKYRGKEPETIMGYCYRQYEVGIGYDQVSDLFPQYQEAACQKNVQAMPSPKILSINTVSSEALGAYTRQDCDSWDIGNLEQRVSHQSIVSKLAGEQWQDIENNSKKILIGFMQVYCSESDGRRAQ